MPEATENPRRSWPLLVAAVVIIVVVAAAWVLQPGSGGGDESSGDSSPPYTVTVQRDGKTLKTYGLAALRALPQASTTIDGKAQTGPLLTTLLDDAGVGSYTSVRITGAAVRDSGRLRLTSAQVARNVQLDFSQRGSVKVCSPWLERKEWVRDVLDIDAR